VTSEFIDWNYGGKEIRIGLDRLGQGPTVLLLPALSSISTRQEMRPLQDQLAADFTTVAMDWPGFGDQPRPKIAWAPSTYANFLEHVLAYIAPEPFATIAAGHAASYALAAAASVPGSTGRLCLIAPTWRGPVPTMLGARSTLGEQIAQAGDLPVLGQLLYRLNVNRFMVCVMARGHVYSDPAWLAGERLAQKMKVVGAPGARYASIRFVTGLLDPMPDREAFIATAQRAGGPILVIYGATTPAKSKAEIEALALLPNIRSVALPSGKLAVHEEFSDAVAEQVRSFLGGTSRSVK
jgi:pimeloyl-ACP methyl ester carboxylesterase